jgi:RNA polymerase sigma-70 factor (ECF subfamily)
MPLDERLAFAMRYIEGMDLQSAAEGCGVSLATLKRRLLRAEQRFVAAAGRAPGLRPWLEGGTTWTGRKEG